MFCSSRKFYLIFPQISQITSHSEDHIYKKILWMYGYVDYRDQTGNKTKTMKKVT